MDHSSLLPNLSPRRSSVSAAVMGTSMMNIATRSQATSSRPPSPTNHDDEHYTSTSDVAAAAHFVSPTDEPPSSGGQYVSRGSYLILKQQLVDERVTYLREVMALRQQVLTVEGTMKRYYETAVERHAHLYTQLQGGNHPPGTSSSNQKSGGGVLGSKGSTTTTHINSPTLASPGYGRRTSLFGTTDGGVSALPSTKDDSIGPVIFDLNTSQLLSDGKTNPPTLTSPMKSPTKGASSGAPTRPIVHLYPPEPPVYTPISLQLVPAERLAAALSSAAVLEEQQELHNRMLQQKDATHRQELLSQQQRYNLLVAEHERLEREWEHKEDLKVEQANTYRARCRLDAFKSVERRLHIAEADREQLAEHVRVLQAKLADVQAQFVVEREAAANVSNQLAAVRQQQGLVLHERAELRSALVAVQKDRNRLEHLEGQRVPIDGGPSSNGGGGSIWGKLTESSRRDEGARSVQFTGNAASTLGGAVTSALQRSRGKQQGANTSTGVPSSSIAGSKQAQQRVAPPLTPRRPEAASTPLDNVLVGASRRRVH